MQKETQIEESEVILNLHQKLHRAKLAIGKVTKNATNPHFKRAYADINALLDAVEPILLENGLLLLQPIQGETVCTQIIDIDTGIMLESCMALPAGLTPQQLGSAITYYRRYTLQSSLSLQAVDDDANSTVPSKKAGKPSLTDDRFKSALEKIEAGEYTVDQLKNSFKLTKEQEAQL